MVARSGTPTGEVTVEYATTNGSALAGRDYSAASGTLTWADGDSAPKAIPIAVSNSSVFTGSRSFSVALSAPGGAAALGSPATATVVISAGAAVSGTAWVYYDGVFNWGGDYSYSATINYNDTSGGPLTGAHDIAVTLTGAYGAWQPYAGGKVPMWNFVDTGHTYLTFAIKPTVANQTAQIYFTRIGDVAIGIDVDPFSGKYGPPPQAGIWSTYKIPLADLGVADTSVYKFAIQDQTGVANNVFYLDNVGFQ